jgi:23S rRNA pseudouridine1911/1915/1917 synthase
MNNEIKVLFEDNDVLIIDKPSGITVNKSDTTKDEPTVQDWVENKFSIFNSQFSKDSELDFYKRAGIVHRIDKETSGILVIAKNLESFENIQLQFKERKVEKTYVALVHGLVNSNEGEISVPVGRLPWNRKRFGVLAGGKEAVTKYKVLSTKYLVTGKKKEPLTLLELNPKTGRTHQIRVHLKYFNHPIFADPFYAGRKVSRDDRKILQRVFLHAAKISFIHPKSGLRLEFKSEIPLELTNIIKSLES